MRAAEALRAILAEVSGAKVREINHPSDAEPSNTLTASVDVYGRHHTLACEIALDDQLTLLRPVIKALCKTVAEADATPVIIAPHISDEARALCNESQAGFLDLEGNANIPLGELFIRKRTIPHAVERSVASHRPRPASRNTAA